LTSFNVQTIPQATIPAVFVAATGNSSHGVDSPSGVASLTRSRHQQKISSEEEEFDDNDDDISWTKKKGSEKEEWPLNH